MQHFLKAITNLKTVYDDFSFRVFIMSTFVSLSPDVMPSVRLI